MKNLKDLSFYFSTVQKYNIIKKKASFIAKVIVGGGSMKQKYQRTSLIVDAQKYEPGQEMEDGFAPWSKIVTDGWIVTDGLVKLPQANGQILCPFIQNRRGVIFIREGDYIIYEEDGECHCCGEDKFNRRFKKTDS